MPLPPTLATAQGYSSLQPPGACAAAAIPKAAAPIPPPSAPRLQLRGRAEEHLPPAWPGSGTTASFDPDTQPMP